MKKFVMLAVLVLMVVSALALPALGQGNRYNYPGWANNSNPMWTDNNASRWANNNGPGWANNNDQWSNNGNWRDNNNNPGSDWLSSFMGGGVSQENQQAADSGNSSQAILVEGGGDNSNQCVAIQPISNTGSALNNSDVLQYRSLGDVGVGDSGNLSIKPSQSITCNQKVDQASSASNTSSGDSWYSDGAGGWWYWDGTSWWYLDSSGWWYYNSDGSLSFYGW